MDNRPWIDIGTLAIARKLVTQGMESFLENLVDRDDFRLRWIFHLDTYPFPGLEAYFAETWSQADAAQSWFDASQARYSRSHKGFGGSFKRVLEEVRNPFFSIEDDYHLHKPLSIRETLDKKQDYVNFKGTPIGSISPSYWSPRLVAYLLEHYPDPPQHATARDFMRITGRESTVDFAWTEYTMKQRKTLRAEYFTHVGDETMAALGVKKYGPLRYYYDSEKGGLVKVKA